VPDHRQATQFPPENIFDIFGIFSRSGTSLVCTITSAWARWTPQAGHLLMGRTLQERCTSALDFLRIAQGGNANVLPSTY
jgi:hypothetical protein|tara:strand:- start:67 stop:306 length:240 start_codon:yes stop_codon:yes gene_type:complete